MQAPKRTRLPVWLAGGGVVALYVALRVGGTVAGYLEKIDRMDRRLCTIEAAVTHAPDVNCSARSSNTALAQERRS